MTELVRMFGIEPSSREDGPAGAFEQKPTVLSKRSNCTPNLQAETFMPPLVLTYPSFLPSFLVFSNSLSEGVSLKIAQILSEVLFQEETCKTGQRPIHVIWYHDRLKTPM